MHGDEIEYKKKIYKDNGHEIKLIRLNGVESLEEFDKMEIVFIMKILMDINAGINMTSTIDPSIIKKLQVL